MKIQKPMDSGLAPRFLVFARNLSRPRIIVIGGRLSPKDARHCEIPVKEHGCLDALPAGQIHA